MVRTVAFSALLAAGFILAGLHPPASDSLEAKAAAANSPIVPALDDSFLGGDAELVFTPHCAVSAGKLTGKCIQMVFGGTCVKVTSPRCPVGRPVKQQGSVLCRNGGMLWDLESPCGH